MKVQQGAPTLLSAPAHHHLLPPAATVPKPPFRDSTSHPVASARGAQPGRCVAAHRGEGLGWEGGRMGLEGPAWVAFPVSPSPHPAVLSPFSAAATVQSKAPFGLWRRWHGEAEVPPLLQHHPVEQAGGLGRLSFPWELGHGATVPGTCDHRQQWQLCLLGEVCLQGLPWGGACMRFCSLTCSSVSACVCWRP